MQRDLNWNLGSVTSKSGNLVTFVSDPGPSTANGENGSRIGLHVLKGILHRRCSTLCQILPSSQPSPPPPPLLTSSKQKIRTALLYSFALIMSFFLSVQPAFTECLLWAQIRARHQHEWDKFLVLQGALFLVETERPTLYFESDCDKCYKITSKAPHRFPEDVLTSNLCFSY